MGVTMTTTLAVVCLVLYTSLAVLHIIEGTTLQAVLWGVGAMCWAGSSYFQWKVNR